jgi:hypothetical protein
MLEVFGTSEVNLEILHRIRHLFLKAEIKEKMARGRCSPYTIDNPMECGFKAAHLLTAYMLCLEQMGRSSERDDYFEVFFLFGAVIQIIDDWKDLEEDLAVGHYSYVTLGFEKYLGGSDTRAIAKLIRGDGEHVRMVYGKCKEMMARSQKMLERLDDPFLARIVYITELRLDSYFRKELKMKCDR